MVREYSSEIIALRARVKLGNEKLFAALRQLKGLAEDKERWSWEMDRCNKAQRLLQGLCLELTAKGYTTCLYLDEGGKKTKKCLGEGDEWFCNVCPSETRYWDAELMGLPGHKVKARPERGEEQKVFLEKLGEI